MNKNDVDIFEKLSTQILGTYDEISLLSKKSPNDAVNKFKLKFINKIVSESNNFLDSKYQPFDDFEYFDEDDMPHNSDVVFILSQYLQCFEKLRADNVVEGLRNHWYWKVKGGKDENSDDEGMIKIKTSIPKRLKS
jgi:hypothetical protein